MRFTRRPLGATYSSVKSLCPTVCFSAASSALNRAGVSDVRSAATQLSNGAVISVYSFGGMRDAFGQKPARHQAQHQDQGGSNQQFLEGGALHRRNVGNEL